MSLTSSKQVFRAVSGITLLSLLFLISCAGGCAEKKISRAEAEKKFFAPTDVSKLTPEARAHLPDGGKFQPTENPTKKAAK